MIYSLGKKPDDLFALEQRMRQGRSAEEYADL